MILIHYNVLLFCNYTNLPLNKKDYLFEMYCLSLKYYQYFDDKVKLLIVLYVLLYVMLYRMICNLETVAIKISSPSKILLQKSSVVNINAIDTNHYAAYNSFIYIYTQVRIIEFFVPLF